MSGTSNGNGTSDFEEMLTGGHPNSLGNTIQVVDIVLADKERFAELHHCYSVVAR